MSALTPERLRRRIGRFELQRELGRGAQSVVWLAEDPRLQRQVALKCLDLQHGVAVDDWLHEARAVGRLGHPNIVPLYEADAHDGAAFLVFEYVAGTTLAEACRRRGAWPAREAVALLIGVLQGLAHAHRHDIVHRDLKPSNILLGSDGRPRVMDFGIAARASLADGLVAGSPGYMSPEATRGETPQPAMDVFAVGSVLAELLTGRALHGGGGAQRWLQRVQHEDLALAADAPVDAGLHAIVRRALARDPQQRFADAQVLLEALQGWLEPPAAEVPAGGHGTLEFLLRRMRHHSDFPALSDAVQRIHRMAGAESERLNRLCDEILRDVALTNKLLRLVNTAHYASAGSIGTVSRAVQLVGVAGIRNLALSLVLLDHLGNRAQAARLQHEFLRALMCGTLASELALMPAEREQGFLGAMFQGLGRLLAEHYLPEEAGQIRQALPAPDEADPEQIAQRRRAVSAEVLGLSFEQLGVGVARAWGLPEALLRCMRPLDGSLAAAAASPDARLRALAGAANQLTDALLDSPPALAEARLLRTAQRLARGLGLASEAVAQAMARARERMRDTVAALELVTDPQAPVQRLIAAPPAADAGAAGDDPTVDLRLQATVVAAVAPAPAATVRLEAPAADPADRLAAGLQDITEAMADGDADLQQLLRMVLETIYRGLDARRVVFCVRDAHSGVLAGRFGLGTDAPALCAQFRIPPVGRDGASDLIAAACAKGADVLITDAAAPPVAARLPQWFRTQVGASSFLLLPLRLKEATVALIYADTLRAGGFRLEERGLTLLRTLRNQATLALRRAGG
jgi:serine/threonine protein kinase